MSSSPAQSGVEDLNQQLVAGGHQLVVLDVRGGTVHHAIVLRQQSLEDSEQVSESSQLTRSLTCWRSSKLPRPPRGNGRHPVKLAFS